MDRKRTRKNYADLASKLDSARTHSQAPDVYGSRKRARRKVIEQLDDADEESSLFLPSDSIAAACLLIEKYAIPPEKKTTARAKKLPPICFVHQIYSILQDNTAVDRELQLAVKGQNWRKFHIIGTLEDEFTVMSMTNYLSMINNAKQEFMADIASGVNKNAQDVSSDIFDRFREVVLDSRYIETSISRQSLLSAEFDIQEKDITQLVEYGLILPHLKLDSFWFSVRNQGIFMSNHVNGRQELLRMLKKRQTKDLLEKQITSRRLRSTILGHEFLIHDLIGSGRAERIKTTMGDLIRLTKKGEQGR